MRHFGLSVYFLLAILFLTACMQAAANEKQAPATPGSTDAGLMWYESYEGSADSSGQFMSLTSSATYRLGDHYSVGAGIPLYFSHPSPTSGTSSNTGIGDFFLTLGASWNGSIVNYASTLTGTAPTGDSAKGFSTGHATFDWDNRLSHSVSILTPFVDAGVGDTVTDTQFFHRPFTSFGYVAHFEGGADIDLSHSFSLTLSAYDIAPWGTQTVTSRFVPPGLAGPGGQHGRVFLANHETTGGAAINRDDGYTAGLSFSPKPYLDFDAGYTRSQQFALNEFSWGIGVNISRLLGSRNSGSK